MRSIITRMLKVIGQLDAPQATVEIDPHVPFILRLGLRPEAGESLRWYCQEGARSHFEMWMNREGTVHRVALVLLNIPDRIRESDEQDPGPTTPTPGRIPVFDVSAWSDPAVKANYDQFTENHRFDLRLGKGFASVRFFRSGEPEEWIVNGRSRFGLAADGRLCRVDLIALTQPEANLLREALGLREPK